MTYRVFDLLNGSRISRSYVEQALAQDVTAIHVTVNNFSVIRPYPTLDQAMSELASVRAHYANLSDVTHIIQRFADFGTAEAHNKLGIVLGYQNVPGVGTDLRMLELFYSLGVRVIQIAHNNRGIYADGCAEPGNAGLSSVGRELVTELNRLGIIIDISHTGERSSLEAMQLSKQPVCITHANASAICINARNKSDAVLDELKVNGGVIGLCYLTPLVRNLRDNPTHADVIAHLTHIRDRIGSAHIGIGSDFITDQPAERYGEFLRNPAVYGTWPWHFPVADLEDQQRLLASLPSFGLTDAEVQGIARDNFLRVFKQVLH